MSGVVRLAVVLLLGVGCGVVIGANGEPLWAYIVAFVSFVAGQIWEPE
jgi:hypothetical protein